MAAGSWAQEESVESGQTITQEGKHPRKGSEYGTQQPGENETKRKQLTTTRDRNGTGI